MCHSRSIILNVNIFLGMVILQLYIQVLKLIAIDDHLLWLIPFIKLVIHLIICDKSPYDLHEHLNRILYLTSKMKSHLEIQAPVFVLIYEGLLKVTFFVSIVVHSLELFRFLRYLLWSLTFASNQ